MRPPNRLRARLRQSEVLHLSRLNQLLHRAGYILNRHLRVHAMLIEQIDYIRLQPLQRGIRHLLDALRSAVQSLPPRAAVGVQIEPELGGNHHLVAHTHKGLAQQLLVQPRPIHFGRVEEGHATLHRAVQHGDHLFLVLGRPIAKAHAHAAQPQRRYFQPTVS